MATQIYYLPEDSKYVQEDIKLDVENIDDELLDEYWSKVEITWEHISLKKLKKVLKGNSTKDTVKLLGLEDCPRTLKDGDIVKKKNEGYIYTNGIWEKIPNL